MGLLNPPKEQAKPQGRKANATEQGAYKNIVTQVLSLLSSPKVSAHLEQTMQKVGPEQAIAQAILQALQMVGQAAKGAGVDVATHTGKAAIKEIVMVMMSMLKGAGMIDNPQQSAAAVMQLIAEGMFGGGQQGQPQPPQGQPQPQGQPMPAQAQPQMGV